MRSKGNVIWMVRLLMISRIVIVLMALLFALMLWLQNTRTLVNSTEQLAAENPDIEMLERGITLLYQAENNFRFYSATYNRDYFDAYAQNLNSVAMVIDSLQPNTGMTADQIGTSLNQKADISNIVIRLKRLTDSLLTVAGQWDTNSFKQPNVPLYDIRKIQNLQKRSSIDSIIDTAGTQKLGFFKKVKKLFTDDSAPSKKGIIVKHTEETKDTIITTNIKATPEYALLQDIHSYYSKKINSYSDGRNQLNSNEKTLATINSKLISEITALLRQVKLAELEKTKQLKATAFQSGERSARNIGLIAVVSVLVAGAFFFLIIYYLGKIKKTSQQLETEKQKAENAVILKSNTLRLLNSEIRQQLTTITGFTEQIHLQTDVENKGYLETILKAASKAEHTLHSITELSQANADLVMDNETNFSLYKRIELVASRQLSAARLKKLIVNLHLPVKEELIVFGHENHLDFILSSILELAINRSSAGDINISTQIEAKEDSFQVQIELQDHGKTVNPTDFYKIFQSVLTPEIALEYGIKPALLLDLSLTKRYIIAMGGSLKINTSQNSGMVFGIQLPFRKPKPQMTQVINQNPPLKFPQGKTILLADDDENCVLLVTIICRKYNIKVVAAENGQQALELASQNNIDLIITDVNMPVLSGLEFTRRLKTIPKVSEIPVIAVTANTMIDEVHNIHDAGFSEILFKPFREKEIIEKISLFLQ